MQNLWGSDSASEADLPGPILGLSTVINRMEHTVWLMAASRTY